MKANALPSLRDLPPGFEWDNTTGSVWKLATNPEQKRGAYYAYAINRETREIITQEYIP